MAIELERRRILLAARPEMEAELRTMFQHDMLLPWEMLMVDSFERARFTLQHTPCDVLLVDESLYQRQGPEGMAWLSRIKEVPLVFLAGDNYEALSLVYDQCAQICLPRRGCMEQPLLLAAGLRRAMEMTDLLRAQRRTRDSLHLSRRQVDRLVNLLWRTTPIDPNRKWLTQRHLMDRLQEEIARSQRHGAPLTVAVGEIQTDAEPTDQMDQEIGEWTTDRINHTKRRCDVAGQYGLKGFLLLLVNTARQGGVVCCRRLQQSLEQASHKIMGARGPIRSYFGLATFDTATATPLSLLSAAEQHLMSAKSNAGERIVA